MEQKIVLSNDIVNYIKRNYQRLLNAPYDYVESVFEYLLGRPLDEATRYAMWGLLENISENGGDLKVDFTVYKNGKAKEGEERKELIRAIISDIELYKKVPDAVIRYIDLEGDKHTIEPYAEFILDGEPILVGKHKETNIVTAFVIKEIDKNGEPKTLQPVKDKERLNIISDVWETLKKEWEKQDEHTH